MPDLWMTIHIGQFPDKPCVSNQIALTDTIIAHGGRAALEYTIKRAISDILQMVEFHGTKILDGDWPTTNTTSDEIRRTIRRRLGPNA